MASPEQAVASCQAVVLTYDKDASKWVASGPGNGVSQVKLYKHTINNTYRVVGRNVTDRQVNVNSMFSKSTTYHLATPTFHQWRDPRHVYGLNFSNADDAGVFAEASQNAVQELKDAAAAAAAPPPPAAATPATPAPPAVQPKIEAPSPPQPSREELEKQMVQRRATMDRGPPPAEPEETPAATGPLYETASATLRGVNEWRQKLEGGGEQQSPPKTNPYPKGTTEAAPPPIPAADFGSPAPTSLMAQITSAKLNSVSKASPSTQPKPKPKMDMHDEIAAKLARRNEIMAAQEAESAAAAATPAPAPAPVSAPAPAPVSATPAVAPPPVSATPAVVPPPAATPAAAAPKIAPKKQPPPVASKAKPSPKLGVKPSLSLGGANKPVSLDFDQMKSAILNEAKTQMEEFTKKLLDGLASKIEDLRPASDC